MLVKSVSELIGRTPLLLIDPAVHGLKNIKLYAKLEHLNPLGSLKDRAAFNILAGELDALSASGKSVIESSSGNMAKAMAVLCAMKGIPLRVVTNRIAVREVKQILQFLQVDLAEFPSMSSCPDPSDPNNPIAQIEREMAMEPDKFLHTSQFTNAKNMAAHQSCTGPEIADDIAGSGNGKVDYLIAGMGTTGSSRGCLQYLQGQNPKLKAIGVVAKKSHVIPGIRNADEMFEVGLFKRELYEAVLEASTDDAIDGMTTLARKLGVLAGPTSGAAFSAACKYLSQVDQALEQEANAVFIVCDRVEWYLSYLQKYRPGLFSAGVEKKTGVHFVSERDASGAPEIDCKAAQALIDSDANTLVVDMRGGLAYKAGHIPGSVNIPAEKLSELLDFGVPFSKSQEILLVCPQGDDSKRFVVYLLSKKYKARSLAGGFISWRDSGLSIERGA